MSIWTVYDLILNLIAKRFSEPQYFFWGERCKEMRVKRNERWWRELHHFYHLVLVYDAQINQLQPVINDDNHKMKPVCSISFTRHVNTMTCEINNLYTIRKIFIMSLLFVRVFIWCKQYQQKNFLSEMTEFSPAICVMAVKLNKIQRKTNM